MNNTRRKLFSSVPRKKLFSSCEDNTLKTVMCMDCGYKMETAASTSHIYCPKCGGTRFNVYNIPESPEGIPEPVKIEEEKSFSRKSLFGNDEIQKEFTTPCNEFEENLKQFSGKEVNIEDCEKLFSMTSDELIEKGYADINESNNLVISDFAYLRDKIFSKLIVSVTKVLDLEPNMVCQPKGSIIDSLDKSGTIGPKGIILIKKAHMISPTESQSNDLANNSLSEWAKDSGIVGDTKIELGDKENIGVDDFMDYLHTRYPDAPKGLIDYLISNGVIKIQGNQVDVLK